MIRTTPPTRSEGVIIRAMKVLTQALVLVVLVALVSGTAAGQRRGQRRPQPRPAPTEAPAPVLEATRPVVVTNKRGQTITGLLVVVYGDYMQVEVRGERFNIPLDEVANIRFVEGNPEAGGQTPGRAGVDLTRGGEPRQFIIRETAYHASPSSIQSSTVFVIWTAIIENPNPDFYGEFPTITVTARDANGLVVGTTDQVLHELPPGGRVAFSSQLTATKVPTTVEFSASKTRWQRTDTKPSDYPPFTARGVSVVPTDTPSVYTVTGEIVNPYGSEVDQLSVTALFRDASGKLLGGAGTFLNDLPAGGSRPFELNRYYVPGSVARVEIVATTWGSARLYQLINR